MGNDFLQRKRDRDFQRRVLLAVEKPKTNRFIAAINSSFFLWVLSAVLITALSSLYAAYQQCMNDAQRISEKHELAWQELNARYRFIGRTILDAKDLPSALITLQNVPPQSTAFKETTLFELHQQAKQALRQSDKPFNIDNFALLGSDNAPQGMTLAEQYRYADFLTGRIEPETFSTLARLQDFIRAARKEHWLGYRTVYLWPECTFCIIVKRYLVGEQVPILKYGQFNDMNDGPRELMIR